MGSLPSKKKSSVFDPKSLHIDLVTKISVINDGKKHKESSSTLNTNSEKNEYISKNDPKLFIYFLCTKFNALKEVNLNDDLNDGNPVEIRKVNIDKKIFPKKTNHFKPQKISNSNKNLKTEKIKMPIHPKRKVFSCVNVTKKSELHEKDDIKEKSEINKNNEFILNERTCKSPQNLKIRRHKKQGRSKKNKNYKKTPSLSTIKSKKIDYENNNLNNEDGEKNAKDSLEPIRTILKEMGI